MCLEMKGQLQLEYVVKLSLFKDSAGLINDMSTFYHWTMTIYNRGSHSTTCDDNT
uniref:Uncharacterized protein n=1 Tax=Arion vulgaris TaxID=1028688 RepID=A0A0B6Z1R1_9EUPU